MMAWKTSETSRAHPAVKTMSLDYSKIKNVNKLHFILTLYKLRFSVDAQSESIESNEQLQQQCNRCGAEGWNRANMREPTPAPSTTAMNNPTLNVMAININAYDNASSTILKEARTSSTSTRNLGDACEVNDRRRVREGGGFSNRAESCAANSSWTVSIGK